IVRSRSPRKQVVPLSTPRRKTGAAPASLRISAAILSTRLAICFALNALRSFLDGDLVPVAVTFRDFEFLGDLNTGHPDDRAVPDQQGDSIADACGDFTINEDVFQLLFVREAEGLEPIAVAAVPYGECRGGAFGQLDELVASCRLPVASGPNGDDCAWDPCWPVRCQRLFKMWDGFSN